MTEFFAHSENEVNEKHLLKDHLLSVSALIREFCKDIDLPLTDEAYFCGQLHDLGKYADLFQARLRGEVSGLDHWSSGAWLALENQSVASALAIQGHHIGLQKGSRDALRTMNLATLATQHPLNLKLSDNDVNRLNSRFTSDNLTFSKPKRLIIEPLKGFQNQVAAMLDVRMLFSCLTDADFLDTEAHFDGDDQGKKYRIPGPPLNAKEALVVLEQFMDTNIRGRIEADKTVLESRNLLWQMVNTSSSAKPGLFTLTAPTGSGKTLAMLKFALEHAAKNKSIKRIILAIPFLSIIEQTAAIYKAVFKAFPENYVLEHHSLAGLGGEEVKGDAEVATERARRLLAENWDAPIIITTNVQLLESLFSNRPSACRKLHNLMESVIMFDEAQTLPQYLAVPTLAALSHLSQTYRTTVLFATATQPAFDALDGAVKKHVNAGWQPVEVAPDHAQLYDALRRYTVSWPMQGETKDWTTLANEIRNEVQVLCVLNLKNHAAELLKEIKNDPDVFHLSTNLCALHRRAVLDVIRTRLKTGQSCRLISTQCVEAGVDVDFPVAYRALAPLDAIAQVAGRCNRAGRLTNNDGIQVTGKVRVFEPAVEGDYRKRYPTWAYFQSTEVTRSMLILADTQGIDLNDPAVFRDYYHRLYDLSKPESQGKELFNAITEVDFVGVAKAYRLIDQTAIQVLVPYGAYIDKFNELDRQQYQEGISAQWIRRAQGLAISIFRPKADHPAWQVLIPAKLRYGKGVSDEWYILEDHEGKLYDDVLGLCLPQAQQILIG